MKKAIIFLTIILVNISMSQAVISTDKDITDSDIQYLETIMHQTWNYLDSHIAPQTGFPTDSQDLDGATNTTNIGLYLASIGPACELGYISREDAVKRIEKIISSVNKLEGKRGFFQNWVSVEGKTEITEPVLATSDFNKLTTGLILVRQFFPELNEQATKIIDRVEWDRLYNKQTQNTYWGYNLIEDVPVGEGRFFIASDCRLVVFYMIATDSVEPIVWEQTHRRKIKTGDLEFFEPGYHLGGMFMQAIDAIFLDELTTEIGCSIADLAWHEISEAQRRNMPVWGWSNCNIPCQGYTEGGFLPWYVVTPHASALVIDFYPKHVIANLKQLDKMGLREPIINDTPYGFRDSIDLRTNLIDNRYLCLDQAMLFLSLTNYTQDGLVRKTFAKDPLVKHGMRKLKTYFQKDTSLLRKWAKRDASQPDTKSMSIEAMRPFALDFTKHNAQGVYASAWQQGVINTKQNTDGLLVEFDLSGHEKSEVECKFDFAPIDSVNLKEIEITCDVKSGKDFGGMRVYLFDDQGQSQYAFISDVKQGRHTYTVKESDLKGILARPDAVASIAIKLWAGPWYYQQQTTTAKSGSVRIEKIEFK